MFSQNGPGQTAIGSLTVVMAGESSTCCGVNLAFAAEGARVFLEWVPSSTFGGLSRLLSAGRRRLSSSTVVMAGECCTCCGVNLAFATVGLKVEIVFLEWTWAVTFGWQTADRFIGGGGGVFCLLWGEPGLRYGGG